MSEVLPYAMSVAGLDPSGGAGLLADIKTLECHRVRSLGICTAVTAQSDQEFDRLLWMAPDMIFRQMRSVMARFRPRAVKIGITESARVCANIIHLIKEVIPDTKVVWDPVLTSSTGHAFWDTHSMLTDDFPLTSCDLITPNIMEACRLTGCSDPNEAARKLSASCPVLLTGGHTNQETVTDTLFINGMGECFTNDYIESGEKHGSGCTLSASIAAGLAKGHSLSHAVTDGIAFTRTFLASDSSKMGIHAPLP
ncbi:MAG: hydroxymethylpyrimidine/phosphomethylpyrimidine kinase [Flavobacteriales bacterium]|nr:hydroxymethylpyrimidine/phosphomethylpyrimidine kinase [Flavobacteriales bacterium]MCB9448411.1 hydroxymethylpyrimidine/phosphomethylpyrimidine kinase [Flavobacteriales bacterium]